MSVTQWDIEPLRCFIELDFITNSFFQIESLHFVKNLVEVLNQVLAWFLIDPTFGLEEAQVHYKLFVKRESIFES